MSYRFGVITERGIAIRPATADADLQAWNDVRRIVMPNESVPTIELLRAGESPNRLMLLAESGREVVGSGFADRSQVTGGFVAPRVLPDHRRRGVGTAVLGVLLDHLVDRGFGSVGAHVEDDAAYAFALRHGFEEVDRQVEQVRTLTPDEPAAPPYEGVEFRTVAQRPELLQRSFALAQQGYADMALKIGPAVVPIDEWLREEATLPAGTFVALEHGIIVGYAGLLAWTDDASRAENGLTVVDRRWRGRGLATALKRRQLAWAAANGIREIVTWTQQGNEAMQRVNVRLGYAARSISRTMRRDLP
jgi:mycothiol synthase